MWPAILCAGVLSLANLTLLALAAAALVRWLPVLIRRTLPRTPFLGTAAVLGTALLALLVSALVQIALWASAFVLCGEFADFETAFYHSAVNFTTLGYGDIIMSRQWRLLGPLEAVNGSLMLGLSAAMLFAILSRLAETRTPRKAADMPTIRLSPEGVATETAIAGAERQSDAAASRRRRTGVSSFFRKATKVN